MRAVLGSNYGKEKWNCVCLSGHSSVYLDSCVSFMVSHRFCPQPLYNKNLVLNPWTWNFHSWPCGARGSQGHTVPGLMEIAKTRTTLCLRRRPCLRTAESGWSSPWRLIFWCRRRAGWVPRTRCPTRWRRPVSSVCRRAGSPWGRLSHPEIRKIIVMNCCAVI